MPATLFENELADGTTPAQTGATTLTGGIGDAIRKLWLVCQRGELELLFVPHSPEVQGEKTDVGQKKVGLRCNRQKLRDEPQALKV